MSDGNYPEIVWDSLGSTIDEREPPEGLAAGGIYKTLHDDAGWLVGWIPTEEIFSPPPRGTYVGHGATFAEVKAIAERDYKVRQHAPRHPH
jgi:hypothetical protein